MRARARACVSNECAYGVLYDKFGVAMKLTGLEFKSKIDRLITVWWPAREVVTRAFSKRFEVT